MTELIVSGLNIYPVKSLAGISVQHATVEPFGLANDRRWMLVDAVVVSSRSARSAHESYAPAFARRWHVICARMTCRH